MPKVKYIYAALLLIVILLLTPVMYERVVWGGIIPNTSPSRIDFRDRRYYPSGTVRFKENRVKLLEPKFYWQKDLYIEKNAFQEVDVEHTYATHMLIYLKNSPGEYLRYTLSGGP